MTDTWECCACGQEHPKSADRWLHEVPISLALPTDGEGLPIPSVNIITSYRDRPRWVHVQMDRPLLELTPSEAAAVDEISQLHRELVKVGRQLAACHTELRKHGVIP